MASAVLAARAYEFSISLDEVSRPTRSWLIVLSPFFRKFLDLAQGFPVNVRVSEGSP